MKAYREAHGEHSIRFPHSLLITWNCRKKAAQPLTNAYQKAYGLWLLLCAKLPHISRFAEVDTTEPIQPDLGSVGMSYLMLFPEVD